MSPSVPPVLTGQPLQQSIPSIQAPYLNIQMPAVKPGLQTTEFWLALLVTVLGALSSVYASSPAAQVAGVVAAALSSMGYGYARMGTKNGAQ